MLRVAVPGRRLPANSDGSSMEMLSLPDCDNEQDCVGQKYGQVNEPTVNERDLPFPEKT